MTGLMRMYLLDSQSCSSSEVWWLQCVKWRGPDGHDEAIALHLNSDDTFWDENEVKRWVKGVRCGSDQNQRVTDVKQIKLGTCLFSDLRCVSFVGEERCGERWEVQLKRIMIDSQWWRRDSPGLKEGHLWVSLRFLVQASWGVNVLDPSWEDSVGVEREPMGNKSHAPCISWFMSYVGRYRGTRWGWERPQIQPSVGQWVSKPVQTADDQDQDLVPQSLRTSSSAS